MKEAEDRMDERLRRSSHSPLLSSARWLDVFYGLLLAGYIILRFALYICVGSFLIWLITQVPEYGWWSTTVRVDTNMASAWLPDEERECSSSPGKDGLVAEVDCYGDRATDHNIPVKFWGKTDRKRVSLWKCRREKDLLDDHFVCRAIN